MSVYTQEVLGLLKRNKKKRKLDKIRDHFEFGKLFQNSSLNNAPGYQPTMEPFVIKWGDFLCEAQQGLVRQDPNGAEERHITMWTDPIYQGDCQTATITKTIISQNANANEINIAGDLDVDNNLNVDGNAVVDQQLTAGSANILDLTEDRIVIVGANGELEDDANFTMDGSLFTANVSVTHGIDVPGVPTTTTLINSNVQFNGPVYDSAGNLGNTSQVLVALGDGRVEWKDDDVVEYLTYGALWQGSPQNLKQELPIGTAGQLLVSDGVTFSWQDDTFVDGSGTLFYLPLWTPDGDTLGDSKVYQDGDNSTPAQNLFTDLVVNINNTSESKLNLGAVNSTGRHFVNIIGPANYISGFSGVLDNTSQEMLSELFTSESPNVLDAYLSFKYDTQITTNKLILGGDSTGTKHPGLDLGFVQVLPQLELETVPQDDTLDKVLVRDATTGVVHQRDASTIKPQVGFDTLDMLPNGWASPDGNFNAYVKLDDTTTSFKEIKDMDWLVDGDRVLVIAENVKTGSLLADNVLRFPTWGSGQQVFNHTSWNQSSIGVGWTGAIDNGYETSTLLYGEKLKIRGEMYDTPGVSDRQMNWDACCKIYSANNCPIVSPLNITTDEDVAFSGVLAANDDGYGGYGNTFTIVSQPSNGTITLNASTGAFTYTPNTNYSGSDQFSYTANDGYCTSNTAVATITINPDPEPPVWVSTDPVSSGLWNQSNLIGGTTLPAYNWEVDDPDHTCGELSYSMTVTDAQGNPATWLTFTPNNPGDCQGTLTGTYPQAGGTFQVSLTVTDPDGQVATQSFPIAGVIPDNDTYILIWLDGSGSMDSTATAISAAASVPLTVGVVDSNSSGTSITLTENAAIGSEGFKGYFIDDVAHADRVFGGCWSVVPGMTISTLASAGALPVSTGVTVQSITTSTQTTVQLQLSGSLTVSSGDLLVFESTAAMRSADYNDTNTLRNLLQDFYASAGTEGAPDNNTDPATNGSDRYGTHVKFGWMRDNNNSNGEDQIRGMGNYGNQTTPSEWTTALSSGGQLEFASSVVSIAFGDESNVYQGDQSQTVDGDNAASAFIRADIERVKDWVGDGISAGQSVNDPQGNALNTSVLGVFNYIAAASYNGLDVVVQGLQNGMTNSSFNGGGSVTQWVDANLQMGSGTGGANNISMSPNSFDFSGITNTVPQNNSAGTQAGAAGAVYKNLIQTNLQNLGFTNI